MNKRVFTQLVVSSVVGGALIASACSGKSISRGDGSADDDNERGGTAGTIDRGGTSGTVGKGGTTGTGGIPPTGGTAGTTFPGGSSGTSGTSGTGGASTCDLRGGPQGTPSARRTIPFTLTVGSGGAGGAANDARDLELSGQGGAGPGGDGCVPNTNGHDCVGEARATRSSGSLAFTFGDGSTLAWTPGSEFIAPPPVGDGELVFIEYSRYTPPVCPFCGGYTLASLSVRAIGGPIIWFGQEGSFIQEVEQQRALSLFGVGYRRSFACSVPQFNMDCYTIQRDLYDIVLATSPEQRISHATQTRVSTPLGEYEVMWASSEQIETHISGCADGRSPARDRGFAASRLDWPILD